MGNKVTVIAGTTTISDHVSTVSLAREIDQSESARFNHHKSAWTAIANTVGLGLRLQSLQTDPLGTPLDFASFMNRLFNGPIQFWQFAATAVPLGA